MSDRERDRDAAATTTTTTAAPRVRRYRCADCKMTIIPKYYHTCRRCGLCGALFDHQHEPSKHHCEPFFDDEDEKAIAAEVERSVSAAMSETSSIRLVPQ